ncbi:hypothetical protein Palpr_1569 [Paludibacter propionicigenes WB4]|uniref:Uncharacterized protein n=1 Tax=Paludibacter propionicigenes (strain DSM 17365 / JCM 13257 / WB4) TaxID=694427 RepID=E4T4S0_PALPW|nr:hypothetical protein Palpr_1569 [Paludibacter propionicigenes WB4]
MLSNFKKQVWKIVLMLNSTKNQKIKFIGGILGLRALMAFLIKLSESDRKSLQLLDNESKSFSDKTYK